MFVSPAAKKRTNGLSVGNASRWKSTMTRAALGVYAISNSAGNAKLRSIVS